MTDVRETNCGLCGYLCGLRVWVDGHDRIIDVKPDPSRYPYDASVMRLCRRFRAIKEVVDHPKRLNYPFKRDGIRGAGKWKRLTWEEALDEVASRLRQMKATYGAESLATCISAPHTLYWPLHRFLNLWGTPNNMGIGTVCWNPRIWVHSLTYGWPIEDELDPYRTGCVIVWGLNPAESDRSLFWKTLRDYARAGGRLIAIDPRRTATARLTNHWLPIKPGTDGALALGMLQVIVQEGIWDKHFVEHWCSGFDGLRQRVQEYPLAKTSKITGVSASKIRDAAVLYATGKPASIFTGLGIDMSGVNCTQTLRAIASLRAVTGNIDTPGASFLDKQPDFAAEVDLELSDMLPNSQRKKKLGRNLFRLQGYEGYESLTKYTKLHGKRLPARYLTSSHPHLVWQAITTGHPYPIRGLICTASNPLLSQANTRLAYEAIKSLDMLVVLDQFLTPTAMLSDYVFPITGTLEQPLMQMNGGVANVAYGGPAVIKPRFERRPDYDFWRGLGLRCGQTQYWPWQSLEEALGFVLASAGISWKEFCNTGIYAPDKEYHKYETNGFSTPSGRIELHSTIMEEFGYDPLPNYLNAIRTTNEFPLTLMTGVRKHPYYSSEFRQLASIRKQHPRPVAEISRGTAERLKLRQGDLIWVETRQGRIRHELAIRQMLDDVVSIEYGWWFPEDDPHEPALGGLWASNANVLTTAATHMCDPILGQWDFRSIPCRIHKIERDYSDPTGNG